VTRCAVARAVVGWQYWRKYSCVAIQQIYASTSHARFELLWRLGVCCRHSKWNRVLHRQSHRRRGIGMEGTARPCAIACRLVVQQVDVAHVCISTLCACTDRGVVNLHCSWIGVAGNNGWISMLDGKTGFVLNRWKGHENNVLKVCVLTHCDTHKIDVQYDSSTRTHTHTHTHTYNTWVAR
jgi:hypothetical protein